MPSNHLNLSNLTANSLALIQPRQKKKVLVWSDCVMATTGFGTVSKHILSALYKTGQYEIDHLAINHFNDFYDKNKVPYMIVPARLGDPRDPFGSKMFINALQKKDYDIIFIINDTFVVEAVARSIQEIRDIKAQKNRKPFSLVYYYPVDCRLLPEVSTMVRIADRSVAYTQFAKRSSIKAGITPTDVIYHGTDINSFRPIPSQVRRACREKYIGLTSDDVFVFTNVNRNSMRKDIARSILAFSEFRKRVTENCRMYIHAKVIDGTSSGLEVDLRIPLSELNLDPTKDIIFPNRFIPAKGFEVPVLNQLYNCADAYITTNLGEGFGLTITEAMACGVPVIAPNHTSAPEILGTDLPPDEVRGYPVECKELIYVDNSGYRPLVHMEDLLNQMKLAYEDWLAFRRGDSSNRRRQTIINNAQAFVKKYSWENVCKDWIKLFGELKPSTALPKNSLDGEAV